MQRAGSWLLNHSETYPQVTKERYSGLRRSEGDGMKIGTVVVGALMMILDREVFSALLGLASMLLQAGRRPEGSVTVIATEHNLNHTTERETECQIGPRGPGQPGYYPKCVLGHRK